MFIFMHIGVKVMDGVLGNGQGLRALTVRSYYLWRTLDGSNSPRTGPGAPYRASDRVRAGPPSQGLLRSSGMGS